MTVLCGNGVVIERKANVPTIIRDKIDEIRTEKNYYNEPTKKTLKRNISDKKQWTKHKFHCIQKKISNYIQVK